MFGIHAPYSMLLAQEIQSLQARLHCRMSRGVLPQRPLTLALAVPRLWALHGLLAHFVTMPAKIPICMPHMNVIVFRHLLYLPGVPEQHYT